jgi:hypothetical protein
MNPSATEQSNRTSMTCIATARLAPVWLSKLQMQCMLAKKQIKHVFTEDALASLGRVSKASRCRD